MTNPTCKDCPDLPRQLPEVRRVQASAEGATCVHENQECGGAHQQERIQSRILDGRKKAMKVLIACEESQEVRKAFRAKTFPGVAKAMSEQWG